jgi:hypothetical protein
MRVSIEMENEGERENDGERENWNDKRHASLPAYQPNSFGCLTARIETPNYTQYTIYLYSMLFRQTNNIDEFSKHT